MATHLKDCSGPFNPDIKVTALKVPPRKTYSDCGCQWEFKPER